MGLTSAMYVGLTGLNAHQAKIDTIGNNIANVNTNGFKSSRTLFQTQYSITYSQGQGPSDTTGGVNPTQVGLGTLVGTTQKNFGQGSIETTGIPSDLAVQGAGLFVLAQPDGRQVYTRDGAFSVDSNNRLVSQDGYAVRGFGVDDNFAVQPTVLQDLTIPLGTLSVARATELVTMDGDLSAAGTISTQGSIHRTQAFVNGGGGAADASTQLTDLRNQSDPGTVLFAAGDSITLSGVVKGDRTLPSATFVVGTDGNTLGDFANWMSGVMGIQDVDGVPGDPGITIDSGALVIQSNAGEANGFDITGNDVLSTNAASALPLSFTEEQAANGSSVTTSFTVYDSLGTPRIVGATFALEDTPGTGPVWRYYLDSQDATGSAVNLGTGTVSFDTQGNYVSADGNQVSMDLSGTGAASPLQFTMDFSGVHGLSTKASNIIMSDQDGYPPGTLTNFGIGTDGTISGTFSNGLTRTLGQVALAVFSNPEGLVAEADNTYAQGPNAGNPAITAPGLFAAGTIQSGALELSNTDLSQEFIGLITTSAGFQASSRVISTSSDMLDQLLLVVR